jgi:hypothetical protein
VLGKVQCAETNIESILHYRRHRYDSCHLILCIQYFKSDINMRWLSVTDCIILYFFCVINVAAMLDEFYIRSDLCLCCASSIRSSRSFSVM